ncbi:MAG TPA: hypothetical protein VKV22_03800 [Rhodanobacteraceae bacterium]|nr:hypothetical protein [Rhodanobacteraceae bacterium]
MKALIGVAALFISAACMAGTSGAAQESNFNAQGYPCLSGVCVNDEMVSHLNTIQWLPLHEHSALENRLLLRTATWNFQDIILGIPASSYQQVELDSMRNIADKPIIALLTSSGVIFCRNLYFDARFLSPSGYTTYVRFGPSEDGKLRVRSISRIYHINDQTQIANLLQEIGRQFPFFKDRRGRVDPYYNTTGFESWGGTARLNVDPLGVTLEFASSSINSRNIEQLERTLSDQQQCRKPVSIN